MSELASPVVKLIADLDRAGWEVRHGGHQTQFVYQGHAVGGLNRKYSHSYVSKLMRPFLGHDRLTALGFKLKRDTKERSTFVGHEWYEVRLTAGLPALTEALAEIERLIDIAHR